MRLTQWGSSLFSDPLHGGGGGACDRSEKLKNCHNCCCETTVASFLTVFMYGGVFGGFCAPRVVVGCCGRVVLSLQYVRTKTMSSIQYFSLQFTSEEEHPASICFPEPAAEIPGPAAANRAFPAVPRLVLGSGSRVFPHGRGGGLSRISVPSQMK